MGQPAVRLSWPVSLVDDADGGREMRHGSGHAVRIQAPQVHRAAGQQRVAADTRRERDVAHGTAVGHRLAPEHDFPDVATTPPGRSRKSPRQGRNHLPTGRNFGLTGATTRSPPNRARPWTDTMSLLPLTPR